MGFCKDCAHYDRDYYDRLWSKEGCHYLDRHVSPTGSCDHYYAKATAKNSNYHESGGCYLTSACVEFLGKNDNCEELTALRSFRDGYMKKSEDGSILVEEYYSLAPKIVKCIDKSEKKEMYYRYISEVIDKCVKLISLNENERTLNEYKFMVLNLKKEFELN